MQQKFDDPAHQIALQEMVEARELQETPGAARGGIKEFIPEWPLAPFGPAVDLAAQRGLRLPLVYNTSGYDSPEALALLDGVVDIYMPDMKYGEETLARKYSHVRDYVRVNREAVREMHRQVGDLVVNADGWPNADFLCVISSCRTEPPA